MGYLGELVPKTARESGDEIAQRHADGLKIGSSDLRSESRLSSPAAICRLVPRESSSPSGPQNGPGNEKTPDFSGVS